MKASTVVKLVWLLMGGLATLAYFANFFCHFRTDVKVGFLACGLLLGGIIQDDDK